MTKSHLDFGALHLVHNRLKISRSGLQTLEVDTIEMGTLKTEEIELRHFSFKGWKIWNSSDVIKALTNSYHQSDSDKPSHLSTVSIRGPHVTQG